MRSLFLREQLSPFAHPPRFQESDSQRQARPGEKEAQQTETQRKAQKRGGRIGRRGCRKRTGKRGKDASWRWRIGRPQKGTDKRHHCKAALRTSRKRMDSAVNWLPSITCCQTRRKLDCRPWRSQTQRLLPRHINWTCDSLLPELASKGHG